MAFRFDEVHQGDERSCLRSEHHEFPRQTVIQTEYKKHSIIQICSFHQTSSRLHCRFLCSPISVLIENNLKVS